MSDLAEREAVATTGARSERGGVVRGVLRSPVLWGALVLIAAWAVAGGAAPYQQLIVTLIVVYVIIGSGLVLLVGVGGQLSMGHAFFLAVGAYTAANVAERTSLGLPGELVVAVVVSGAIGVIVGLPSLRLSGLYLAIATLALGFAGQQLLYNLTPVTGGGIGKTVGPAVIGGWVPNLLFISLILCGIVLLLVRNLLRGRTGRALHAIRTAETAAHSVGIEVARRRVLAFAISGALAAVGGVLYAHAVSYLTPAAFDYLLSIQLILMVIIGGQRRLLGAVLGAAFVIGLPEQFRDVQVVQGILYGAVLVLLVVFFPGGLVELLSRLVRLVRRRTPAAPLVRALPGGAPALDLARPGEALSLRGVTVRFGGVTAVDDVSLDVAAGEVLAVIGPNGAGKTTLFNAVTGMVRSTGEVSFGDTRLDGLATRQRALLGVGRTFQNLSLHGDLTPLEHVLIGRHRYVRYSAVAEMVRWPTVVRAEREAVREAYALLEVLGIDDVAHERADELPYGIQKRIDVARMLAGRPRLVLLDEPAAGLAHDEADRLIDRILELTRPAGATVVLIEHNIDLVTRVADRMCVMTTGSLLMSGRPAEVVADSRVVEAYLGG